MPTRRTDQAEILTDLILSVFRTNNLAIGWGDRIVLPYGLTSARWQVLGAIALADRPQPVAWIARDLGVSRQGVQRIVNDLQKEGQISFQPNPHHRRAQLIVMTEKGQSAYDQAINAYNPKVNALANDMDIKDLELACRLLATLRGKLEEEVYSDKPS